MIKGLSLRPGVWFGRNPPLRALDPSAAGALPALLVEVVVSSIVCNASPRKRMGEDEE